jgi:hypothetical protein
MSNDSEVVACSCAQYRRTLREVGYLNKKTHPMFWLGKLKRRDKHVLQDQIKMYLIKMCTICDWNQMAQDRIRCRDF